MAAFPDTRMRRLRRTESIRSLVRETVLTTNDLVFPLFIVEGKRVKQEIASMPGIFHLSPDMIMTEIEELRRLGIMGVILFGIPSRKDEEGSPAYSDDGIVQKAITKIKKADSGVLVISDVCLCGYTSHGHCGILDENKEIENDLTLAALSRIALSHARAGVDMVAPSDMMDGRVKLIRSALDDAGFQDLPIMSYSAKYSSAFYGPFRLAAESSPKFGDRKSHQMDYSNLREAIREIELDVDEGADIVMIKPALPYLDVIRKARDTFRIPIAAYNVSGEYAMVKAAVSQGLLDNDKTVIEILTSIKRAGADIIITYHAKEAARLIKK